MPEQMATGTAIPGPLPIDRLRSQPVAVAQGWRRPALWAAVAGFVVLAGAAWVALTGMRPSYDAFGWLVWGRQLLHGELNTDGAPSWKPLTFLFTLPYALAGANPQLWLWMITSSAAALAGSVFAARIAYRLTGPCPRRQWAPLVAGAFAGVAVLGLNGYSHQVLIANSDPMVVSLCLAAIDSHLSNRPRLALGLIVLVSLGRPEGWPFAVLYAGWLWRSIPSARVLAVGALALIPVAWFLVPALTSHSWFISGDLALNSRNAIHGDKLLGVLGRLRSLYALPMQVAVAVTLLVAAVRRNRQWMGLAAAAILWVAVEVAFAYHGWSAVARYLLEPGAVLVVLAAAGLGRLLAYDPPRGGLLRIAPAAVGLALVVTLIPTARARVATAHAQIAAGRHDATELARLQAVVARDGGATAIKSCGQPVTLVGNQSEVAWVIGLNVGNVGYRIGKSIDTGLPIVVLKPHDDGWQVRPIHIDATDAARCERLRTDSAFGPPT